ncbi:serine--pyruvate aminotransferase, mitochondrial-like [Aricia agestis]|uniref:serine--pyruvate aminotransferase, mitochondrial-like n=1 Tax=Aricia agestis TaxID=91739 RepID=UPI001C20301F|nr:serine--pyruvate aminotransferase, mitochondrial-like [Aricia agestis]
MIPTTFASPNIEDWDYKEPIFAGPGPCNYSPAVLEALKKPCISPLCDEYVNILEDIRTGLQYLFQTRSKLVLAISGAGHAGMEALICNLVAPGETLVMAVRGEWDQRAVGIAKRHRVNVVEHRIPCTDVFTFEELEGVLKKHRPRALYLTHGDSSTGTIQKLDGLGDICHKYGTLLLIDAIVSAGGSPLLMDAWGVDGVVTATQKSLSGPAGTAPVAFSERAEEVINQRKHEPPFYLDVKILAQQWNCYGNTRGYHHTMNPVSLWTLRASLKDICEQTLPKIWERLIKVKEHFHKRLPELGFGFLIPNPKDRFINVTTVVLPNGIDPDAFVRYMLKKHNIFIFPGRGPTVGKCVRVGNMGVHSSIEKADAILAAMVDTKNLLSPKKTGN